MVYIVRLNLSAVSTELGIIGINNEEYGYLGSVFLISFACGRLINGMLGDKIHPRFMLFIGLILAGVSNIGIYFIDRFLPFIVLWGVNGYAQSMLWGSLLSYISFIAPYEKRVTVVSLLVSSVGVGSVVGLGLALLIKDMLSWKLAFLIPGLMAVIIAFFPLIFFNEPVIKPQKKAKSENHIPILKLLVLPSVYAMLIPAILHGVIKDNISSWAPKYFETITDWNTVIFLIAIPITGMIGRLLYPTIYKLLKFDENRVSIFAGCVCAVSLLPLVFGVKNIVVAAICLSITNAVINIINTSFLSMFPIRFQKTGNVSSVTGMMDFATYMGAGIGSALYGILIKDTDYSIMFYSWIAIAVIISTIVFIIFKNKKLQYFKEN